MKKFVFISDYFAHQYTGGAELTTNAAIIGGKDRGHDIVGINCSSLTKEALQNEKESFQNLMKMKRQ